MSKIIGLKAQNVKRLHAVEITPDGHIVEISGRNGQGKTSVLDSIAYALGGKDLQPAEPIRRGSSTAEVEVDLGDLRVTRRWTKKGSYLTVTAADGATVRSPQKVLDELVGRLTFDPLAFTRMKPADQAATLKEVAGLDFDAIERERQQRYEQRTDVNRSLKAEKARLDGMPQVEGEDEDPGEELSVAELLEERAKVEAERSRCDEVMRAVEDAREDAEQWAAAAEAAEARVEELAQQLEDARKHLEDCRQTRVEKSQHAAELAKTAAATQRPDLSAIDAKLASADEHNRRVREIREHNRRRQAQRRERESQAAEVNRLHRESEELSKLISACDARKQEMLAEAELPIDGLTIDDDVVRYHGTPFDQCSSAEQLRVSVAMGLAMNPKLRVMLIRDGSLLDRDSRKVLADLAEQRDAQVWCEIVSDDSGPGRVVIEDGRVLGAEAEEAEPATAT